MQFVRPMPFGEAVRKLGAKSPIGSKLSSSEWRDVPAALRERAFFSSRVESARFLQRASDAIAEFLQSSRETLPDGQTALKVGSRAEFISQMREFALAEGMGPLEPGDAGTVKDITSEKRLGLIFDVQTQQANDYGYWRQGMDADVLDEFPAQRFIRVKAVKEPREYHTQFEDGVWLKTDPIWKRINEDFGVPWGPWGWGCGHDVEDVDRAEAEQRGLLQPGQKVEPAVQDFNENLKASTAGLEPELIDKLKEEFGSRIEISETEMRWAGPENPKSEIPKSEIPEPIPPAIEPKPAVPAPIDKVPDKVGDKVSAALQVTVKGGLKELVKTGLAAIDQVHDDGVLPGIPVTGTRANAFGRFTRKTDPVTGLMSAVKIEVKASGEWPALSTVHETGHFLDLEGIGTKGKYSSETDAAMKAVIDVARQTEAIRAMQLIKETTTSSDTLKRMKYFLSSREIWARAYAQFITETSGNATLVGDLARVIDGERHRQWSTEDFKPIKAAIQKLFEELGWMKGAKI